ncbi:MAG: DNA polymerase I, partial [Methylococcaceae bacterium]
KTLILVDGSSFLYRAFHALPPLSNSLGEPTHAVLGVSNMLRKLVDHYPGCGIGVVFDAPGRNFRDELFEQYKAHRPPMPNELRSQIAPLHELIQAMGLPVLMESGVEADDVIGTLTHQAVALGYRVIISTGDKDMAQLVNSSVLLENTMSDSRMDEAGVVAKFGVRPAQIIDYLTLVGDTSDNIPGVPGVGPKTAAKWLEEYGTLERLLADAASIRGKVGESLRASLAQIPISRLLATIRCDVALPLGPDDLQPMPADSERLKSLLRRMEFKSWLKQLETQPDFTPPAEPVVMPAHYQTVLTREDLDIWLARLHQATCFSFDTETTSLNYSQAEIVGCSFAIYPGEAAYIPLAHRYDGVPMQLDRAEVLALLKPLLEDEQRLKVGQNLKYDAHVLANHGIHLKGMAEDTMLQSYVLNSTATRHDMDSLAAYYLDYKTIHYEDVAGKGTKQIPFAAVTIETASQYAAEDADITLKLHQQLRPRLKSIPELDRLYQELEIPLIPILVRMEETGVLVDPLRLAEQSRHLSQRISEIQQQAYRVADGVFNLGSTKQIQTLLYDTLKLPVVKKTPKGQPSTDESVLQELAENYELPRLVLEYLSLTKLKSTYTDKLIEQINPRTGRVHTSYHQAVTATGRLSSSDPNLQNIPIRTEEGRKIRQAFIAPPGYRLLAADYSQIELRIMAHLSEDPHLCQAFAHSTDVHRATAAEVFGVTPEQVTSDQRRSAKAINFGLIYGMSAFGLAKQLNVSRERAQFYIDLYFARYPAVKAYMERARTTARDHGFVETLFGRRLYIPDIRDRNTQRRQYAERTAINAPMQGAAADIIKRAMLAVEHWIHTSQPPLRMIMQVHDELVFEVEESCIPLAIEHIRPLMCEVATLSVPLEVNIGVGMNWDEAH